MVDGAHALLDSVVGHVVLCGYMPVVGRRFVHLLLHSGTGGTKRWATARGESWGESEGRSKEVLPLRSVFCTLDAEIRRPPRRILQHMEHDSPGLIN